jgi:hypothetical protein
MEDSQILRSLMESMPKRLLEVIEGVGKLPTTENVSIM